MSVFRPVNTGESNLYTIRLNLPALFDDNTSNNGTEFSVNSTTYTDPTINNLPSNFSITYDTTGLFTITFGKIFTSIPSISIQIIGTTFIGCTINIVSISTTICTFNVIDTTTAAISGIPTGSNLPELSIIITGPVKLGVTTGNSNKGWGVAAGNDPTNIYTYMNVGIGTGNPGTTLEVAGTATYRNNVVAKTVDFNPTSAQSGTIFMVAASSALSILLPTPVLGLRYKFIVTTTSTTTPISITSTSNGINSDTISYANLIVADSQYSITTLSTTLVLGGSSINYKLGDWVECICDGGYWWWTGIGSSIALN